MTRRHVLAVVVTTVALATTAAVTGLQADAASKGTAAPAADTCTAPAWSATTAYTGGAVVTFAGHTWSARWWTYADLPGGAAGVWVDGGACTGSTTTAPSTSTATSTATSTTTSTSTTAPTTSTPPSTTTTTTAPTTASPTTTSPTGPVGGSKVVGYFVEWGIYGRNYHVKNIQTSGSADKLTHLVYAFGNVTNGRCAIGDSYADYDRAYGAADSVDGVADTWDSGALRGSFGQLRRLKKLHPGLKVVWSFGGWTWSGGFPQAAADPAGFADSCYQLVKDPRWADVFDGIDIDWEYPNACGLSCDTGGRTGYTRLMAALWSRFGSTALVTSAITADGTSGGKIEAADYAGAAQYVNWYMPMTYDYFGAFSPQGPTAPHAPLTSFTGQPVKGFDAATAISKLTSLGVPSDKLLLGIGFYGRGWTGVTQDAPGGTATGAAPGTYEAGIEDYKVLRTRCPATGTAGGTAYGHCGSEWWGYDTPATVRGKMAYARQQGLGGAFFWELSGDTADGELVKAVSGGLG